MPAIEPQALGTWVLGAGFLLSCLFGAIAQRTHFCTMGALSDALNIGDYTRLRQWVLAIAVAMAGFALLAWAGLVDPAKTLHANTRWFWLSALVGGWMFGVGMVLASGCGNKTLVRIGGGNLRAVVVLLVLGVSAFITLKGLTAVLRVATVDRVTVEFDTLANLPYLLAAWLGVAPRSATLVIGLGLAAVLAVWALRGEDFVQRDNLLAGLGSGAIVAAMWWVSGHLGHLAEHPQTLEEVFLATNSGRAEALSFVAPIAYTLDWLMFFSDSNKVLTLGVVSVVGVIVGSAVQALRSGNFRWEGFGNTEDLANHLVGAVFMGVGGVTALGCTIGQGLSGVSTLSLTSLVALAAIAAGAATAFRYQMWRIERMV